MSSKPDKRKHFRLPVKIPARIHSESSPANGVEAEVLNISERGAFVHCSTPINLGQEITLEIHFTETQMISGRIISFDQLNDPQLKSLKEKSVVRWARGSSMSGFGVEFVRVAPDTFNYLKRIVEYFKTLSKAGVAFEEEGEET